MSRSSLMTGGGGAGSAPEPVGFMPCSFSV